MKRGCSSKSRSKSSNPSQGEPAGKKRLKLIGGRLQHFTNTYHEAVVEVMEVQEREIHELKEERKRLQKEIFNGKVKSRKLKWENEKFKGERSKLEVEIHELKKESEALLEENDLLKKKSERLREALGSVKEQVERTKMLNQTIEQNNELTFGVVEDVLMMMEWAESSQKGRNGRKEKISISDCDCDPPVMEEL